jgi:hypothetical protein
MPEQQSKFPNNSAHERGLWRSTKSIHEKYDVPTSMPTCGAEQSSLPWNVIIYNFPGCSAAETAYKVHQQRTITSRLLANPGSPTEPHPRLRNGHPDAQGVQLQSPNMSFASTDCFGPHNIDKRIMVKKAVKRYRSNNLKNDYESKEINSQDSEHYLQPHFMDGYIKKG